MKKVAIFGDIMLDKYIIGSVDRISPEAPVPVVRVIEEKYMPGGCANVAANVSTLRGKSFLFGFVGKDSSKYELYQKLNDYDINFKNVHEALEKTIQKTRLIAHGQQLARVDIDNNEIKEGYNSEFEKSLSNSDFHCIIISDYAKGMINLELMNIIKKYAISKNIPIFVDPKPSNMDFYKDVYLITPNRQEAEIMSNIKNNIEKAAIKLSTDLNCNVAVTLGEDGILLVKKENMEIHHYPTKAREVYDVSGAGDTVIAAIAMSIIHNYTLEEAIRISNVAAGVKVGKHGTAPVSLEELAEFYYVNWE